MVENFQVSGENKDIKERMVENLVGIKLFHHIVDTIETANFIRDKMTEGKLTGRVTFLAKDRMNTARHRDNDQRMKPALEYVQYDVDRVGGTIEYE